MGPQRSAAPLRRASDSRRTLVMHITLREVHMRLIDHLRRPSVAVVDLQGTIGGGIRPLETSRLLTRLREDESARAVVLNIDSPGGSAVGSDLITRAVERLRREKPVVTFIGGLGASGGYMVASAT